jgi:hypothetical protein
MRKLKDSEASGFTERIDQNTASVHVIEQKLDQLIQSLRIPMQRQQVNPVQIQRQPQPTPEQIEQVKMLEQHRLEQQLQQEHLRQQQLQQEHFTKDHDEEDHEEGECFPKEEEEDDEDEEILPPSVVEKKKRRKREPIVI